MGPKYASTDRNTHFGKSGLVHNDQAPNIPLRNSVKDSGLPNLLQLETLHLTLLNLP